MRAPLAPGNAGLGTRPVAWLAWTAPRQPLGEKERHLPELRCPPAVSQPPPDPHGFWRETPAEGALPAPQKRGAHRHPEKVTAAHGASHRRPLPAGEGGAASLLEEAQEEQLPKCDRFHQGQSPPEDRHPPHAPHASSCQWAPRFTCRGRRTEDVHGNPSHAARAHRPGLRDGGSGEGPADTHRHTGFSERRGGKLGGGGR